MRVSPMTSRNRSSVLAFIPAVVAIVVAFATGYAWIGRPFRLVQLVTILGLGLTAGVCWMQAIVRLKQNRSTSD
jgi:hypothetical protein